MKPLFEELDYRQTPMGEFTLGNTGMTVTRAIQYAGICLALGLWVSSAQAEPAWIASGATNGAQILEWFSSPAPFEEWPADWGPISAGNAAGKTVLDFLRHYEDRIPGWAEPAAGEIIVRIGQLQDMRDVFVVKGGYRNLALADMTSRVIYVGLVRALLSTQLITPALDQQIRRAIQFEIPLTKWRMAIQEETGWSQAELEKKMKLWSSQLDLPASPSAQETRHLQFYIMTYAATGETNITDALVQSLLRLSPDVYDSAKACNLMIMYTKVEYLFRYSLPSLYAYVKADPNREHFDETEWIQARVGKAWHPMLSTPSMGGAAEEVREVIRASSQKSSLEFHAGIVWASKPGEMLVP